MNSCIKNNLTNLLAWITRNTPNRLIDSLGVSATPVFMLHRLNHSNPQTQTDNIDHLKKCLGYIRKHGYQPITLTQLTQCIQQQTPLPPKSVAFTIDDGFWDQYEIAAPIFNQFDIPLTCFVIADFLDQKIWPWDDQLTYIYLNTQRKQFKLELLDNSRLNFGSKEHFSKQQFNEFRNLVKRAPQDELYTWLKKVYIQADVAEPTEIPQEFAPMTWAQAQHMIEQGHDIGPHTMTHRILSQLNDENANYEIKGSFQRNQQMLQGASSIFAYPTGRLGDFSQRDANILSGLGSHGSVTTSQQQANISSNQYQIPRMPLPCCKFDFIQYLTFFESLKDKLR